MITRLEVSDMFFFRFKPVQQFLGSFTGVKWTLWRQKQLTSEITDAHRQSLDPNCYRQVHHIIHNIRTRSLGVAEKPRDARIWKISQVISVQPLVITSTCVRQMLKCCKRTRSLTVINNSRRSLWVASVVSQKAKNDKFTLWGKVTRNSSYFGRPAPCSPVRDRGRWHVKNQFDHCHCS